MQPQNAAAPSILAGLPGPGRKLYEQESCVKAKPKAEAPDELFSKKPFALGPSLKLPLETDITNRSARPQATLTSS